ncbi:outer membrane beta-barrel protein, partial [bacterium]|nr:outer membrane beta-barrel protein [bacterium]
EETAQGWIELGFNRLSVKAGGLFRRDDFLNHLANLEQFDHKTAGASAQVGIQIFEKFHGLLEYNFEAVRFDQSINRDYDAHQGRAGVDGELSPKLTLSIKLGAGYQIPYTGTGNFQDNHRFFGFTAACALSWLAMPNLTLQAAYRRDLTYAVGANFETVDYVDLNGRYSFGPSEKLFISGDFAWEHARVDNGDHVDRIHARATFGYRIQRWLELTVSYDYTQTLASGALLPGTYDEHRGEVSLAIGL